MVSPAPSGAPMPPPMFVYFPQPMPVRRPIGVTILGILAILFGIFVLATGILTVLGALVILALPGGLGFGTLTIVIGVLVLLFGILWLLAGFGLLRLRTWAWWLAIVVSVLTLLAAIPLFPGSAVNLAVAVVILLYLLTVRRYFGQPRPMGI